MRTHSGGYAGFPGGGAAYDRPSLPLVPEKSEVGHNMSNSLGHSVGAGARPAPNNHGGKRRMEDDPPYVTPAVAGRPLKITKTLMGKLAKLPAPPLDTSDSERQTCNTGQHHEMTPVEEAEPRSNPAAKLSPLDLLSTVSSHIKKREDSEMQQKQQPAVTSVVTIDSTRSESPEPYTGERNSLGQRHGRGKMNYPNGCHYNGQFLHDRRHGFGECAYPNGCVYSGFWHDGQRDGVGRMIYADRSEMYEGEWREDRRHGTGTYYRSDGRADVARYDAHDMVGEGVQWSPNREFVVRLVDGENCGQISVGRALEICRRLGVHGAPRKIDAIIHITYAAGPEAYIVIEARLNPSHRERFASYASQVPALVAKYGGEYKVMGGTHEPLEGEWGATRIVMHRWPNAESAREFWHSEEYRELKMVREGTGDFRIMLLEGLQRKELDE